MSENLLTLKSYLDGEGGGKGTHFVTRVNEAQLGRTLGEAVLHPRDLPFGPKHGLWRLISARRIARTLVSTYKSCWTTW